MSDNRQRRQSIVPLPVPSNLTSSEDENNNKNSLESDIEIIESDNDQVTLFLCSHPLIVMFFSMK